MSGHPYSRSSNLINNKVLNPCHLGKQHNLNNTCTVANNTILNQHLTTETYPRSKASPPLIFKPTPAYNRMEKQESTDSVPHTCRVLRDKQHQTTWPDRPTCSDTNCNTPLSQFIKIRNNKIIIRVFHHKVECHIKTNQLKSLY